MQDPVITSYPSIPFGDLRLAEGVAFDPDPKPIAYGLDYFQRYVERAESDIAETLNRGRVELVDRHCSGAVLDVGIGAGTFIKTRQRPTYGFDVNPFGVEWLKQRNLFLDPYKGIGHDIEGITLWDCLEHLPNPSALLSFVGRQFVFVALPIFPDLTRVRQSRHYKPQEHLTYWSVDGLVRFFSDNGFKWLEISDHELLAGRESILSFVFRRANVR